MRLEHKPGKSAENSQKILQPVFNQPIKIFSCLPCSGQVIKFLIYALFPPLPFIATTVLGVIQAVPTLSGQISQVLQPFSGVYLFSRNDSSEKQKWYQIRCFYNLRFTN